MFPAGAGAHAQYRRRVLEAGERVDRQPYAGGAQRSAPQTPAPPVPARFEGHRDHRAPAPDGRATAAERAPDEPHQQQHNVEALRHADQRKQNAERAGGARQPATRDACRFRDIRQSRHCAQDAHRHGQAARAEVRQRADDARPAA